MLAIVALSSLIPGAPVQSLTMRPEYICIIATAILWGGYPLVSRSAGYGGARGALVLMLAGLIPILVGSIVDTDAGWPSKMALAKLIGAGVMMGGGLISFHTLANSPMDASVSIPIVDVAMLLVSALGAIMVFSEPVTAQKVSGISLMLVGIAMLRPA